MMSGNGMYLDARITMVLLFLFVAGNGSGQDSTELARKTQNPVADMISVPFQNYFNFGVGPENKMQYILNIQPVIPQSINERWNWIHRTIIPIIDPPKPVDESGIGGRFSAHDNCGLEGFKRAEMNRAAGSTGVPEYTHQPGSVQFSDRCILQC